MTAASSTQSLRGEAVETANVVAEERTPRLRGQWLDETSERIDPRAGMIGMRVVGSPHEAMRTDVVHDERRRGLVVISGDETLPREQLARRERQREAARRNRVVHRVGPVKKRPDPSHAALEHAELERREPL